MWHDAGAHSRYVLNDVFSLVCALSQFFHGGGPLQAPLYQVLESYGCYRPDVGYVQGMSHIASMLLLNMEPLPAFIAMCNLLNVDMYFKFFRMNAQQMKLHLDVFQQVFKGPTTTQRTQRTHTEQSMEASTQTDTLFAWIAFRPLHGTIRTGACCHCLTPRGWLLSTYNSW